METPAPERWLLRCPVDDALIAPGVTECADCGLSTAPLRALATAAAEQLRTATLVDPAVATSYVDAASAMVPESENYLLDAGRALGAAGAYEAARDRLTLAASIAPGREDIKAELDEVTSRIDPTDWLTEGLARAPKPETPSPAPEPVRPSLPARRLTRREQLQQRSNEAWREQEQTEPGSEAYWALGHEMTRIAVAIAALSEGPGAANAPASERSG